MNMWQAMRKMATNKIICLEKKIIFLLFGIEPNNPINSFATFEYKNILMQTSESLFFNIFDYHFCNVLKKYYFP